MDHVESLEQVPLVRKEAEDAPHPPRVQIEGPQGFSLVHFEVDPIGPLVEGVGGVVVVRVGLGMGQAWVEVLFDHLEELGVLLGRDGEEDGQRQGGAGREPDRLLDLLDRLRGEADHEEGLGDDVAPRGVLDHLLRLL